jgi:thiamine-phosphate pyrophosphorylase
MPKIYLISPQEIFNIDEFACEFEAICRLEGRPAFFQLRLKNCERGYIERCIEKLLPICEKYGVEFVINDDIALALKYNTNLHVGSDDASMQDCINFKKQSTKHLGVSCYNSIVRAKEFENIADCISFGAMFVSNTKPNAKHCDISVIAEYRKHNSNKEIAIIGGIDSENIGQISDILPMVSYICVISCIWG